MLCETHEQTLWTGGGPGIQRLFGLGAQVVVGALQGAQQLLQLMVDFLGQQRHDEHAYRCWLRVKFEVAGDAGVVVDRTQLFRYRRISPRAR